MLTLGKLTLKILDVAIFISHLLIWDQWSLLQTESLLQRATVRAGCISYQKDDEYWNTYTKKGVKFLFVFTSYTKYALTIHPKNLNIGNEVYTFEDINIHWPDWCRSPEIAECIANLREIPGPSLAELLNKYEGILVKNPDGTIDKISHKKVDPSDFIKDGHFICQFSKWEGYFDCRNTGLTSLEGAPREVGTSFYCSNNNLTSLEGAPREVGGNFNCRVNRLTSLDGSPSKIGRYLICDNNLRKEAEMKGHSLKLIY